MRGRVHRLQLVELVALGQEQLVGAVSGGAEFHVIEGRAAADITECAKELASDLIVIATHGLTGIEHLLMGSVTEKVVRRASCPVFTVTVYGKNLIRDDKSSRRSASSKEKERERSGVQLR